MKNRIETFEIKWVVESWEEKLLKLTVDTLDEKRSESIVEVLDTDTLTVETSIQFGTDHRQQKEGQVAKNFTYAMSWCVDRPEVMEFFDEYMLIDAHDSYWVKIQNKCNMVAMNGFTVALDYLRKDQNAKILLLWRLPEEIYQPWVNKVKNSETFQYVSSFPNVHYARMPIDANGLKAIVDGEKEKTMENALGWSEGIVEKWVGEILHVLKHLSNYYEPSENEQDRVESIKSIANKHFPWLWDNWKKLIDYVTKEKFNMPLVRPGEALPGVWFDCDWTLLTYPEGDWSEQSLNPKVVALMKQFEEEWKEITVWTWWDVEEKERLLKEHWINYTVVSKRDYTWWIADVVVDDLDMTMFVWQTKIFPKKFIQVSSLEE